MAQTKLDRALASQPPGQHSCKPRRPHLGLPRAVTGSGILIRPNFKWSASRPTQNLAVVRSQLWLDFFSWFPFFLRQESGMVFFRKFLRPRECPRNTNIRGSTIMWPSQITWWWISVNTPHSWTQGFQSPHPLQYAQTTGVNRHFRRPSDLKDREQKKVRKKSRKKPLRREIYLIGRKKKSLSLISSTVNSFI